jgi:exodeoxyribonuclease V gamma subunit
VLHLSSASRVRPLASALAEVLAVPLADPMMPEWLAVPTVAMRRWLALELARSLGASRPDTGDGVAANISFNFPGSLRQVLLEAGRGEGTDAWHVDSLVWAVLEVLRSRRSDAKLGPLTELAPGATWFGRARRLADLFDRYAVRRPELVLHWAAGRDLDGTGRLLAEAERWQPHLWRLVRAAIGTPSPPERLGGLLDDVRSGAVELELPPRVAIFGVTTLPSGSPFLELIDAVAARRELHLMLLDPSPPTTARVRTACLARSGHAVGLRAEDDTDAEVALVSHPLLSSWGRPYRERTVLLASGECHGLPAPVPLEDPTPSRPSPESLLSRLQDDIRSGRSPGGDFALRDDDRSLQVHSCHGQARQVQVLRDAILHLLEEDPSLREEDIAVLSPAIDQFAPLIEAGFGTSVDNPAATGTETWPRLSYRITDRSLMDSYPVLAALDSLLALAASRCTATSVLEFASMPVVRKRFSLDDDAVRTIGDWMARTNVRWGLDGPQRVAWGLPAEFDANTLRAAVERVLMGMAVSDDGIGLAPGGIAPLDVESGDIAAAGRFADLAEALRTFAADVGRPRPAWAWSETLSGAIDQFFALEDAQQWQLEQLRRIVAGIGEQAIVGDETSKVELSLADLRRLLSDQLRGSPQRSDFFRGGITISSLTPLRWLPFRVVCLLGLDDAGTIGSGAPDGDDLAAMAPLVGDRDPRAEVRQALLEAVLAAGDHLVITRTGRNARTNQEIPRATVLAELRDTITATLAPGYKASYDQRVETAHPFQPFDDRCFSPGALNRPGPWSFDSEAYAGAIARTRRQSRDRPLLEGPLAPSIARETVITISELKRFFNNPSRAFWRQRVQLHLLSENEGISDDLVTALGPLEHWSVGDRLLAARLSGHATAEWERHERALGLLPPGRLGDEELHEIEATVDELLAAAEQLGVEPRGNERLEVEVALSDGTRLVEAVVGRCASPRPGPALVTFSKLGPKRKIPAWLDLVALQATDPMTSWRSVVVGSPELKNGPSAIELCGRGDTPLERAAAARSALEVAVDCYRRGMREPIPLFASLSYKLHKHKATSTDWRSRGQGEGEDEANRLSFGDIAFADLCGIEARDDDPAGPAAGRAARFAAYFWGAVEQSSEETS